VANTPASYAGGPGFKSWPRDQLSLSLSWLSSVLPGKCRDSTLNYAMATSFHILSNSSVTISFDVIWSKLLKSIVKLTKKQTSKKLSLLSISMEIPVTLKL
jgi:hypothetical protein